MVKKEVKVQLTQGLHGRGLAVTVHLAMSFKANIVIEFRGIKADAKKLLSVMGINVGQGAKVTVFANGEDEDEALEKLVRVLESKNPQSSRLG